MDYEPENIDFECIPTGEIIQELMGRFDHVIFVGIKIGEAGARGASCAHCWSGGPHICIGLAADLSDRIISAIRERER